MTKFVVIGAGMAGLLAAAILRDECDSIIEAQEALPNNHSALLRFRTSVVGDALNIPFRRVDVIKSVLTLGNPVADSISYALKTTGTATLRSIVSASPEPVQRYIAPSDFIHRLESKVAAPIHFGTPWIRNRSPNPVISTMPMPALMSLLDYKSDEADFKSSVGFTCRARLRNVDVCASIYIPAANELAYRASITGDQLIVEYAFPHKTQEQADAAMEHLRYNGKNRYKHIEWVLSLFGLPVDVLASDPQIREQRYAKILPVSDDVRKRFMLWATEHHNIYSFGRFATWRPGLMLDDLVNDLRVIQRLAGGATSYDARRS